MDLKEDLKSQEIKKQKYTPLLKNYDVPRGKIKTHVMEKLLLERLFVLVMVEKISESPTMSPEEKIEKFLDILQHHKLKLYLYLLTRNGRPPENPEHLEYSRQEKVAHIFLNGIFSSWGGAATWVRKQELTLFNWETFSFSTLEAIDFMVENGATPPEATEEEKEMLREKLETYREDNDVRELEETVIYKVPWQLAVDLGGTRKVAHHLGVSYVPEEKVKGILPTMYEEHLKNEKRKGVYETAVAYGLGNVRLEHIRGFLFYVYSMKMRDHRKIRISMNAIDNYVNSFPPCARIIHEELANRYHLKFNTRKQYWLFLKGIGTEANDVSEYMRQHFVEMGMMKEQGFKEHHYFIRLLFGLAGSCIDYGTPDCADNLQDVRGSGEVNGCPFGNPGQVDIEDLDKRLTKWKIGDTDKQEILEHRRRGDCSEACSAYFKAVHEKPIKQEIINPLDFFMASREVTCSRLQAIPEIKDPEQKAGFSDEQLKAPLPNFPHVFSKELRARIRGTLSTLVDKEKKQQPKKIGEVQVQKPVQVQNPVQIQKKAEVPKPKEIVAPVGRRVSLMPKPSSSSSSSPSPSFTQVPKSPVAGTFVPASQLAKEIIAPVGKRVSLMPKPSSSPSQAPKSLVTGNFVPASQIAEEIIAPGGKRVSLMPEPSSASSSSSSFPSQVPKSLVTGTFVPASQLAEEIIAPVGKLVSLMPKPSSSSSSSSSTQVPKSPLTGNFVPASQIAKEIIAPVGRRVSLMPKPSPSSSSSPSFSSSQVPKSPVARNIVPASHLAKLRPPPPNEKPLLTEEERAEARDVLMKQALQLLETGDVASHLKEDSPRDILIKQTRSTIEADLCPQGKALVERACLSLNPEVPVTTEVLIDETLSHIQKDKSKNIVTDFEPPPSEGEEEEEPKKDWSKGWKKRKKAVVWIRISEDDPDPNVEEMGKTMMKLFKKNIRKLPIPLGSKPHRPEIKCSSPRKRRKNEDEKMEEGEEKGEDLDTNN